jgi:hypothetical protein
MKFIIIYKYFNNNNKMDMLLLEWIDRPYNNFLACPYKYCICSIDNDENNNNNNDNNNINYKQIICQQINLDIAKSIIKLFSYVYDEFNLKFI